MSNVVFFSERRLKLQEPCHITAHLLNRTVLIYDVSLKIIRLKLRLQEMSSINHNFTYLLTCAAGRCLGWAAGCRWVVPCVLRLCLSVRKPAGRGRYKTGEGVPAGCGCRCVARS